MKRDSVKIRFLVIVKELAIKSCLATVDLAFRLKRMLLPTIKEESTTKP